MVEKTRYRYRKIKGGRQRLKFENNVVTEILTEKNPKMSKKKRKGRFKKGSAAAKRFMAKLRALKKKATNPSHSTKFKRRKMPKRRKRRTRRYAGVVKPLGILVSAGIYGALREKISRMLAPITGTIPLGTVADEVALFALSWFVGRQIKPLKEVAKAGMFIEAARIGEAVITGTIFPSGVGLPNGNGVGLEPTIL